jgi:hypothetical protein
MEANVSTPRANNVRKEVIDQPIVVSKVYKATYQTKDTMTAELKQTVITKSFYPTKSVGNELKDNLFSVAELGIPEGEPFESKETRVTWNDVPLDATVESVTEQLKSFPEARIYKMLSNQPIISSSQQAAIEQGLTSLEKIADQQAVRYPLSNEKAGQLVISNGKPFFRVTYFSKTNEKDTDTRDANPDNVFMTTTMQQELSANSVVAQSIV